MSMMTTVIAGGARRWANTTNTTLSVCQGVLLLPTAATRDLTPTGMSVGRCDHGVTQCTSITTASNNVAHNTL